MGSIRFFLVEVVSQKIWHGIDFDRFVQKVLVQDFTPQIHPSIHQNDGQHQQSSSLTLKSITSKWQRKGPPPPLPPSLPSPRHPRTPHCCKEDAFVSLHSVKTALYFCLCLSPCLLFAVSYCVIFVVVAADVCQRLCACSCVCVCVCV